MTRRLAILALALAAAAAPATAGTDGEGFKTGPCTLAPGEQLPGSSGNVVHVGPSHEAKTIQAGVDAASDGDTVLIDPGVYREAVKVRKNGLRIRGTERNGVELDGRLYDGSGNVVGYREIGIAITPQLDAEGNVVGPGGDRVLVENLTVHHYRRHGVYWNHVKGYWGRYLTAYDNGLYGLYAFDARCGQFDHSYASGNADSGFYIGECYPCDAVITDILAENNALGYSGTNAGGNLTLRNSVWRHNAFGIVPNSLDGEERPPQRGQTIRNNLVADNNNKTAPGTGLAGTYWGVGIAIAGGRSNAVYGNTVTDNGLAGIVVVVLPDQNVWIPTDNTVWGNTVTHTGDWPDALDLAQGAASGPNNCWADNDFGTSAPPAIEDVFACGAMASPPGGDPRVELGLIQGAAGLNGREPSPWQTYPAPPAQPNQPSFEPLTEWLPALGE